MRGEETQRVAPNAGSSIAEAAQRDASGGSASYWQGDTGELDYGPPVNRARQAYAAQAVKRKDHVAAGLLAVFMGLFGIHKFYLGCNQAGFIMLAVSIIGGIVSFGLAAAVVWAIAAVEGIIYLSKSQTDFDRLYVIGTREWF